MIYNAKISEGTDFRYALAIHILRIIDNDNSRFLFDYLSLSLSEIEIRMAFDFSSTQWKLLKSTLDSYGIIYRNNEEFKVPDKIEKKLNAVKEKRFNRHRNFLVLERFGENVRRRVLFLILFILNFQCLISSCKASTERCDSVFGGIGLRNDASISKISHIKTESLLDTLFWSHYENQLKDVLNFSDPTIGIPLSKFIETSKTTKEISQYFRWDIDATFRFMKALAGFGLIEVVGDQFVAKKRQISPKPNSDLESSRWFAKLVKDGRRRLEELPTGFTKQDLLESYLRSEPPDDVKKEIIKGSQNSLIVLAYDQLIISQFFTQPAILAALKTGKAQLGLSLGLPTDQIFDHYETHGSVLSLYSAAFSIMNNQANQFLSKSFHLPYQARVLDIGGGAGNLAHALLVENQSLLVTIYDHPESKSVLEKLQQDWIPHQESIKRVYGDFFKQNEINQVGLDGFTYLEKFNAIFLGWILHDWNDQQSVELLRRARAHLDRDGSIVVLEKIMEDNSSARKASLDFLMMVMANGKERTLLEYGELFKQSGLKIDNVIRNPGKGRDIMILKQVD